MSLNLDNDIGSFRVKENSYIPGRRNAAKFNKRAAVANILFLFTNICFLAIVVAHYSHSQIKQEIDSDCSCDNIENSTLKLPLRNFSKDSIIKVAETILANYPILKAEPSKEVNCSFDFNEDDDFIEIMKNFTQDVMEEIAYTALNKINFDQINSGNKTIYPPNCAYLKMMGDHHSGIRTIYPQINKNSKMEVYCDQETDGGGWTIFQRRDKYPTREDFDRNWKDYVKGFGKLSEEYWLGLENIHRLTTSTYMTLRIDLEDWSSTTAYAKFSSFSVGDANSNFRLIAEGYSGNAGDSFADGKHHGMAFTTKDHDNDKSSKNCAESYTGGWWFNSCMGTNLNGKPLDNQKDWQGITYGAWRASGYSLKKTVMMVRPSSYQ